MEKEKTFLIDGYGRPTTTVVKDKDGKAVNPGDVVEVKHCVGRYGQTETVRGTFVKATVYGVHLIFNKPYTRNGRNGLYTYPAEEEVQFAISQRDGVFYDKHNDFEHGHETYMLKIG